MARSIKDLKLWDNSLLARKFNALVDEVERRTVTVTPPLLLTETGSNTNISIMRQRSGGGSGGTTPTGPCPFDVTLTAQALPSTHFDLTVQPGTVNEEVPSGLLTVTDYDPATTVFVKAHCLTDGKSVTSSSLVVDSTPPAVNKANASSGTSTLDICLAVVVGGTAYKTLGWCGSITVTLEQVFLEDKVSPTVGESPYIRWYQWSISAA